MIDSFGVWQTSIVALIASLLYISLWYVLALRVKRIDIVDSAWGLGFVYVGLMSLLVQPSQGVIQVITLGLVTIWGLRLFTHITARNLKKSEDARYAEYRRKWGNQFKLKAYTNIYLVQGLLIVLVSTPVIAIMNHPTSEFNALVITGFIVWVAGLLFEIVADHQLRQFLKTRAKGQIMQNGLWKYSRHPNYFGEITCWWGASIVALGIGGWWGFIGAVTITYLIVKASGLPPLEKHYADNKQYQQYKSKTSALIPLPPR